MYFNNSFVSFGSNYKFEINKINIDKSDYVLAEFEEMEIHNPSKIHCSEKFIPIDESCKTVVFSRINLSADDEYDKQNGKNL